MSILTSIGIKRCRSDLRDLLVSGDKNMVPLKVANSGFFCFNGTSSCPESKTRTCTDYRKGQEHSPITD